MILTATINEVKRRITFDNPNAVVAVKGDYEVNGVAFAFPAIYEDDFDLSTAVKTVYYKATDGIIYNHVVTDTDTDTGYPLWVFKDEINKGAFGDVEFALVCDKVEGGNIVKRWVSMITAFRVQRSIEIDESEQEDNEQTYSERLAYLMTQMANMQVTVNGLASGAPTAVSLASAMTDTSKLYVYTGSESGYTAGHWYYYNGSAWADGGQYGGTSVDPTLTVSGAAADAKVTGDKIAEIKEDLSTKTGLSEEAKQALLACFTNVAWINEHGQDYYDALENALYPPVDLVRITAVYTQSGTVYTTDSLDSLKPDLAVTAHYTDGTSGVVTGYMLSGALTEGTSTITVSYGGKSATFNAIVTYRESWDYEWYSTSGTLPPNMVVNTSSFAPNNEYLEVKSTVVSALNFNHVGAAKMVVKMATLSGYYNNNPQLVIKTAEKAGAKVFVNTRSNISSNCNGNNTEVYTLTAEDFHEYELVCEEGDCKLYIDGVLADSGEGRTDDGNIDFTGIGGSMNTPIRLKSIKYKALG